MCEQCNRPARVPSRLSRRQFLRLGLGSVGAGAAWLLAGCRRPDTLPPTATIPPVPTVTTGDNAPTNYPTLAGRTGTPIPGRLVLSSLTGDVAYTLAPNFRYYNALGEEVTSNPPPAGISVLAWVGAEGVLAAQRLPPIGDTDAIPTEPTQPQPTGETRPLGPLTMITRAGWGAAERQFTPEGESGLYDPVNNPTGWMTYPEPLADQLHTLAVHHSALEFYRGARDIQRLHMSERGFADIGYHFLIDGLGQLYEGRPVSVRGAHVGGFNTGLIGVCLLGNFEEVQPVQAQLDTLEALTAYLARTYTLSHLAGHADFQPDVTLCPGESLRPLLPALAERHNLIFGTGGAGGG